MYLRNLLQPPYLQEQLSNNHRLVWQPILGAKPSAESRVEDLITAIAKRVYPDEKKEKPVELAVKQFLRLTDRQCRRLSEDDLNRKIEFLKFLASDDFISQEGYECSESNIVFKLALAREYTAFNDIYGHSKHLQHRATIQEFVKFVKSNTLANAIKPDSFRRRAVMALILDKPDKPELAHIVSDLRGLIEIKIPGVFKLYDKLGENYDIDNLLGISSELTLAKTLQKQDFKIIELSHEYNFEEDRRVPRQVKREIDIIAEKDERKFYIEAKHGYNQLHSTQIKNLITYAKQNEATPVLVINKDGSDINKEKLGYLLWNVGDELRSHLKIWDRNLVDITDNFQPIEPPPVQIPELPEGNPLLC